MAATTEPPTVTVDEVVEVAVELRRAAPASRRIVLGLAGPPAAGKSTVAAELVERLNAVGGPASAALVAMDGFHLADPLLRSLGRLDRKGAPDTFDTDGYLDLLSRLRHREQTVYAPVFDRGAEVGVVGAVEVASGVAFAVTEGNYLLLDAGTWAQVRPALDWCGYVDLGDGLRRERLRRRHEAHGRSPAEALERVYGSDESNALLVAATRGRADALVNPGC